MESGKTWQSTFKKMHFEIVSDLSFPRFLSIRPVADKIGLFKVDIKDGSRVPFMRLTYLIQLYPLSISRHKVCYIHKDVAFIGVQRRPRVTISYTAYSKWRLSCCIGFCSRVCSFDDLCNFLDILGLHRENLYSLRPSPVLECLDEDDRELTSYESLELFPACNKVFTLRHPNEENIQAAMVEFKSTPNIEIQIRYLWHYDSLSRLKIAIHPSSLWEYFS